MRLADEASSRLGVSFASCDLLMRPLLGLGLLSRLPPLSLIHLLHTIDERFRDLCLGFGFGHCLGFGSHSSVTLFSLSLFLPFLPALMFFFVNLIDFILLHVTCLPPCELL